MQKVGWSTPQKVCWLKKTCTTKCWNWENWCKVCFHQVIKLLPIFVCFGQLIKHGFSFALYGYVKDCCSDICIERRSAVWLRDEELTSLHSFCRDGWVLEMLKGPRRLMTISLKSEICVSFFKTDFYGTVLSACVVMSFLTNPGKKCSFMQLWKDLLVSSVLVAIFCHCGEHSTAQFLLVIIICRQLVPAHMFEGRQHQLAAEVLAGSGICFMFMIHDWMFFSPLQKIILLTECKYEDKLCSPNIGNEMHSFFRHSVAIDASCHYWFVHVCAHAPCKANSITVTQLLQRNHLHLGSWLPWTGHPKGSHRAVDTQKRCPMHRSHQVFCKKWHLFGVCSGSKHLWYLKRSLPGSPKNCHVSHHLGPSSLDYQTYHDLPGLCEALQWCMSLGRSIWIMISKTTALGKSFVCLCFSWH